MYQLRRVFSALALVILAPTACQAANWDGVRVLPKRWQLNLLEAPGGAISGGAWQMEWPAAVRKVDGSWLQLGDAGGYTREPFEGWVKKDDIVRLEEAQTFATREIQKAGGRGFNAAQAYWLRGIYWELHDEVDNALADYRAALAGGFTGGEIHQRIGRALARSAVRQTALLDGPAAGTFDQAQQSFEHARRAYASQRQIVPQLEITSGDAWFDAFLILGGKERADAALARYRKAQQQSPNWFVPPYRQGRLLLACYQAARTVDPTGADPEPLREAAQCFTESIRLNPNWIDSYRERAEALYELSQAIVLSPTSGSARFTGSAQLASARASAANEHSDLARRALLNDAFQSSERAYLLGNNREPKSLEVKARIQAAIADTIYRGPPPAGLVHAMPHEARSRIATAQSMLMRAGDLAQTSANHSRELKDIDERLRLAADCRNRANEFADFLAGKPRPSWNNVAARVADVRESLQGEMKIGAEKNRGAINRMLSGTTLAAATAQQAIADAQENPTPETFAQAQRALAALDTRAQGLGQLNHSLVGMQAPASAARVQSSLNAAQAELEELINPKEPREPDPVPTFTPLFLNAE